MALTACFATQADVECSNGLIHVIDAVLIPIPPPPPSVRPRTGLQLAACSQRLCHLPALVSRGARFLSLRHYSNFLVFNFCDTYSSSDGVTGNYHPQMLFNQVMCIPSDRMIRPPVLIRCDPMIMSHRMRLGLRFLV
jgi:hypothetical protein